MATLIDKILYLQKIHIRVAISQKFSEEELKFPIRNISKMIQKSATIVAVPVDFVV